MERSPCATGIANAATLSVSHTMAARCVWCKLQIARRNTYFINARNIVTAHRSSLVFAHLCFVRRHVRARKIFIFPGFKKNLTVVPTWQDNASMEKISESRSKCRTDRCGQIIVENRWSNFKVLFVPTYFIYLNIIYILCYIYIIYINLDFYNIYPFNIYILYMQKYRNIY